MSKGNHQIIVTQALKHLINKEHYTQVEIGQKFQQLGIKVGKSSLSNLKQNNSRISPQLLKKAAEGFLIIMERELCQVFSEKTKQFVYQSDCIPSPIQPPEEDTMVKDTSYNCKVHNGRIDVSEKVALYQYATSEIIEIGIRLKSFQSYFSSKRESAFFDPITKQLQNGVHFKCYVADASGNLLKRYITDRALANPNEREVLDNISDITHELQKLFTRINREGYRGKMQLYRYDHFPYYHVSVADGSIERGKMYLSPYLYGVSRANAPVLELSLKNNKSLYKKYWRSIKAFIDSPQVFPIPTA